MILESQVLEGLQVVLELGPPGPEGLPGAKGQKGDLVSELHVAIDCACQQYLRELKYTIYMERSCIGLEWPVLGMC